jgi:hypothetical protein
VVRHQRTPSPGAVLMPMVGAAVQRPAAVGLLRLLLRSQMARLGRRARGRRGRKCCIVLARSNTQDRTPKRVHWIYDERLSQIFIRMFASRFCFSFLLHCTHVTRSYVEQGEAADTTMSLSAQSTKKSNIKSNPSKHIPAAGRDTFLLLVNVIRSGPFDVRNSRYIIYHS